MMRQWIGPVRAAVVAAVMMTGCGDATAPRVPTTIDVDQATVALEVGDTVLVTARVLDQHGVPFTEPPAGHTLTWTTTNAQVATVDGGSIAGTGAGQATIRAQAGSLTPVDVAVQVEARLVTGQISFSYSGAATGTFSINSTFRVLPTGPDAGEWVVTFHDQTFGSQDILAARARLDGRVDIVWFWVLGGVTTPVTRPADDGFIIFGFAPSQETAEEIYDLVAGSVTFTAVTARQAAGTFQLTMVVPQTDTQLQVTNGTFNVPVARASDLGIDAAGDAGIERGPIGAADLDAAGLLDSLRRLRAAQRR